MEFNRYQHIERLGTVEVDGIELGTCFVFPKIDGSNGQCFISETGEIKTGSRNRELSLEHDNQGFYKYVLESEQCNGLRQCLEDYPSLRFIGEWLIKHSLNTYKETAWNKFYVFDVIEEYLNPHVIEDEKATFRYLPYEEYKIICDKYKINYIPCIKIIKNGTMDDFIHVCNTNEYLIEPGKGIGEGIVIKNYEFRNKFGRQTWAKIVTSEFKEIHYKTMGSPEQVNHLVEDDITNEYCTLALVDKTKAKIEAETGDWSSKYIPRLLHTVYHELVKEETYNFVKKYKQPTINFKTLSHLVTNKIKQLKPELF